MPVSRLLVSSAVTACVLSGCATEPPARPMTRSFEIPVSLAENGHVIDQGTYRRSWVPTEGTYEQTSGGRPTTSTSDLDDACHHPLVGRTICDPVTIAMGIAVGAIVVGEFAAAGIQSITKATPQGDEPPARTPLVEDAKSNSEKTEHLREVLSDSVLKRLDETLADSFKSKLGWTHPTLSSAYVTHGMVDEPTVNLPSIEVGVWRIHLFEPARDSQRVVVCALVRTYPTYLDPRIYRTCRHEIWLDSATYSKGGDEAALIARLTAITKRIGEDMAEALIAP